MLSTKAIWTVPVVIMEETHKQKVWMFLAENIHQLRDLIYRRVARLEAEGKGVGVAWNGIGSFNPGG